MISKTVFKTFPVSGEKSHMDLNLPCSLFWDTRKETEVYQSNTSNFLLP